MPHARLEAVFLNIVCLVGGVEHDRHIIGVLLLSDARVYSHYAFHYGVDFEADTEEHVSRVIVYFLKYLLIV